MKASTPQGGAGHTPTPWILSVEGWCYEADIFENQPIIVRAVNNFDALLQAAKEAHACGIHDREVWEKLGEAIRHSEPGT